MDRTHLPSALRGTARHIRECRNDHGENPYEKLIVDSGHIDEGADEIDRLRDRLERADKLLFECRGYVDMVSGTDELIESIDAFRKDLDSIPIFDGEER